MARRPYPLNTYAARRAALFQRLVRESRLSEATAELRISAWESEARMRDLDVRKPEWWDPAWDWILKQRRRLGEPVDPVHNPKGIADLP
jgi:hypothetical protein